MSLLADRLREDVKQAMRAGDRTRLATLRMAMAAIKQREVDERIELDDAQISNVLQKMIRQRQDSVSQFEAGGRTDLVARERAEIEVLSGYLPRAPSATELDGIIDAAIATTGATSVRDMSKVMAEIKARTQGGADMSAVSALVRERLSKS
jgi:uncharacterized protein YqeY